jgi:hypothetical protein
VIEGLAFDCRLEKNIFPCIKESTTAEATDTPLQWLPVTLYTAVRQPGCESEYSLPHSAKVKNIWNSKNSKTSVQHN